MIFGAKRPQIYVPPPSGEFTLDDVRDNPSGYTWIGPTDFDDFLLFSNNEQTWNGVPLSYSRRGDAVFVTGQDGGLDFSVPGTSMEFSSDIRLASGFGTREQCNILIATIRGAHGTIANNRITQADTSTDSRWTADNSANTIKYWVQNLGSEATAPYTIDSTKHVFSARADEPGGTIHVGVDGVETLTNFAARNNVNVDTFAGAFSDTTIDCRLHMYIAFASAKSQAFVQSFVDNPAQYFAPV